MNNEKGITIVELLAAITILLIISSLVYGVLIGANHNYNQISEKNSLEQEANIIISTIKSYHQQKDSYYLTYDTDKKEALIGANSNGNNLLGSDIVTFDVSGDGVEVLPNTENKYKVNSLKFISIHLILEKQGEKVEIDTIIKRY